MYRGFRQQLASGPGYRTDHLLMMSFDPNLVRYTEAQSQRFFEQVAERARTVPGVKIGDDDDVDPDVERFDRHRDDRAGRVSVPGREGQRHGPVVDGGRVLLRHDGDRAARRAEFPRRGLVRRAARRDREPAPRPALLAESGSARQAFSTGRRREAMGRDRRDREDQQVHLHRRAAVGLRLPAVPAEAAATNRPGRPVCRRSVESGRRRCARWCAVSTRTCRSSTSGPWRSSIGCARSASSTCWSAPWRRWG